MEPIIRVSGLGKKYLIRHQARPRYETLRDTLAGGAQRLLQKKAAPRREEFWALHDVSFEVKPGDKLGIIGRNGAGKTTLLKILSRITEPSAGRAEIRGRVASLLEVGTGFHPELTGRENIFLNGAILGMRRREIARKFDEIVAFAEVEKFLDTPVKRYSSGMAVRLAFAVAAHLEPEILLIDEVLAVGDAEFQRKCLGKMQDVSHSGRTVLFVSHNMSAVSALCSTTFLLEQGCIAAGGDTAKVVDRYLSGLIARTAASDLSRLTHYGNGKARFISLHMKRADSAADKGGLIVPGDDVLFEAKIKATESIVEANIALIIYDMNGYRLIDANTALKNKFVSLLPGEEAVVQLKLQNLLLKPDKYLVGLWMGRPNIEDIDGITYASSFMVEVDTRKTLHSQVFPGWYQCQFQVQIDRPSK
jgi:lipopolysaccharide transport system ATP-binding protein